jgi:tryptophan synthase alpha chain
LNISRKFKELKNKGESALIGYAVAGYPSLEKSIEVIRAMIKGGVDILEIGIPFSDPIADGPTIQRATYQALVNGIEPKDALYICKEIGKEFSIPLAIMTYYNIIYKDINRFVNLAAESNVSAFIIPDLIVEESKMLRMILKEYNMDLIMLVSPNTSIDRLRLIASVASGFLYLISVYGTTGERRDFKDYTRDAIRRVKQYSKVPLAVGFGISKPEHVRFMIENGADGVIVGSAFINAISNGINNVEELARDLKSACK